MHLALAVEAENWHKVGSGRIDFQRRCCPFQKTRCRGEVQFHVLMAQSEKDAVRKIRELIHTIQTQEIEFVNVDEDDDEEDKEQQQPTHARRLAPCRPAGVSETILRW